MLSPEDTQALVEAFGHDGARERQDEYIAACAAGRAEAERLSALEPGAELYAGLVTVQQMLLDEPSKVLVYAAWERQNAHGQAQQMAVLHDLTGGNSAGDPRLVVPDLALQTGLSERTIGNRTWQSNHTAAALPLTWEAQNAGRITTTHAWMMANVTRQLRDDLARQVEERVLEKAIAKRMTPGELGAAARIEILRIDPEGVRDRADAAKKERTDVRFSPDEDDMATVSAFGDAWTNRQVMDEINRRADSMGRDGDDRSIGERRHAAWAEAFLGQDAKACDSDAPDADAAAAPSAPARRPKRATALLLVSLPTLLGGSGPAYLDGYGPITAEMARRIAKSDIAFRRLVFDPMTGLPVDIGDRCHDLTEPMRRWLDVRDRECLFPGCCRRAVYCDADHAVEWPEGETTCDNCGLLCRKHHNLKTDKLWKLQRNPDNSVDWESPLGFTYHRDASTYEDFLDHPDVPDPWARDDEVADDPDPPDVGEFPLGWRLRPPPPQDEDDVDYDAMVAANAWRLIGPRTAEVLSKRMCADSAA